LFYVQLGDTKHACLPRIPEEVRERLARRANERDNALSLQGAAIAPLLEEHPVNIPVAIEMSPKPDFTEKVMRALDGLPVRYPRGIPSGSKPAK
jgi:hypothetical protein